MQSDNPNTAENPVADSNINIFIQTFNKPLRDKQGSRQYWIRMGMHDMHGEGHLLLPGDSKGALSPWQAQLCMTKWLLVFGGKEDERNRKTEVSK